MGLKFYHETFDGQGRRVEGIEEQIDLQAQKRRLKRFDENNNLVEEVEEGLTPEDFEFYKREQLRGELEQALRGGSPRSVEEVYELLCKVWEYLQLG